MLHIQILDFDRSIQYFFDIGFLFITYFLGGLILGFMIIISLWDYFEINNQEKKL